MKRFKLVKISENGRAMFEHFASCQDVKRLPSIPMDPDGFTALECFCHHETHGGPLLPCRDPELLSRAMNGKAWNGVTVKMVAEDLIGGLAVKAEVSSNYPEVVAREIFALAQKLALSKIGFVPSFICQP